MPYIGVSTVLSAAKMMRHREAFVQTLGVETFRRMYAQTFPRYGAAIASVSRLPGIAHAAEIGYWVFSRLIRPYLPKRRVVACAACNSNKRS